jgi:hypothetical protein
MNTLRVEAREGRVWLFAGDTDTAAPVDHLGAVALSDDAVFELRNALNNAQRVAAAQRQITGYVRDIDPQHVAPQAAES